LQQISLCRSLDYLVSAGQRLGSTLGVEKQARVVTLMSLRERILGAQHILINRPALPKIP
jgi:hypothetical protein